MAIYSGEVHAVVVNGSTGPRVYTLEGADQPYRVMVEQMQEGTVTLDRDRLILYANPKFAAMVLTPQEEVTGSHLDRFLAQSDSDILTGLMEEAEGRGHSVGQLTLCASSGDRVPIRVSVTPLEVGGVKAMCLVASDLREQIRNEALVKEEQLSRRILEQAGEGVVVMDPEGNIVRRSTSRKV